jgi:hypothetical protein
MYGFSTKVYDNGKTSISGIIWVPEGSKSTSSSKARFDLYFDVFETKQEAEEAREEALAEV